MKPNTSFPSPQLTCPECGSEIQLSESLAAPILESTRLEYETKLAKKDSEISAKEQALKTREVELHAAQEKMQLHLSEEIAKARQKIAEEEAKKARLLMSNELEQRAKELTDIQEVLRDRDAKLKIAQNAQLEVLRKQRELDDEKRELDLTIEKRVQDALVAVKSKAKQEVEEELKLKVSEKEQTIAAMQRQIEDLKRRAEQGSQQLQGEVQELELEKLLRAKFSWDIIEPVPKGEFGGDVLQTIIGPLGTSCGRILWESKRTKNWSESWLGKLREDQRIAKADLAIIVSQTMPKEVETFGLIDAVWVTNSRCAIPLAVALRQALIELSSARNASQGQLGKMELVYNYLLGSEFRLRVQAIVEAFTSLREDLEREKKAFQTIWAKREKQIEAVVQATTGMYGDLQGIAGRSLKEVEGLGLTELEQTATSSAKRLDEMV